MCTPLLTFLEYAPDSRVSPYVPDVWHTVGNLGDPGGQVSTLVGDGKALTVGEAQARLSVSDTTVRSYVASDLLRAWWTGGGHTRIDPESVDELLPLLQIPPGVAREAAFAQLRARNLAKRRLAGGTNS